MAQGFKRWDQLAVAAQETVQSPARRNDEMRRAPSSLLCFLTRPSSLHIMAITCDETFEMRHVRPCIVTALLEPCNSPGYSADA